MNILKDKKTFLCSVTVIIVALLLIVFPQKTSEGVKMGIENCLNIIIPSLFPFMVLTIFLSKSNIGNKILKYPAIPISKLTGLNSEYVVLFIQGMIGGFPAGAKSVSILKEKNIITSRDAEILVCFCTGAGPSFLISAIGCKMFLSQTLGLILFISNVLTSFTLMFLYASRLSNITPTNQNSTDSISVSFFISVKEACSSIAIICAMVMLFSIFLSFLQTLKNDFLSVVCGMIEVTSGTILLSKNTSLYSILMTSAICGFNGFCVIMQIVAICSSAKISTKKFLKSRFYSAALNTLYTFLLLFACPIEIEQTFITTGGNAALQTLNSPLPALMLMICCFCFPICISKIKNI